MHRARAANFCAGLFLGDKAEQLQNLSHGDDGTDFLKSDAWHGSNHPKGLLR